MNSTSTKSTNTELAEQTNACFGPNSARYDEQIKKVMEACLEVQYSFTSIPEFERTLASKDFAEANKVYWSEVLDRCHLAAVTSLKRNYNWVLSTASCRSSGNLQGYAASIRALMEATGDSLEVMVPTVKDLTKNRTQIKRCADGLENSQRVVSSDMEDLLIAFSHARKVNRKDNAPDSHKAKPSIHYINLLSEKAELPEVKAFYQELNEITHPASRSVFYQLNFYETVSQAIVLGHETHCDMLQIEAWEKKYHGIVTALPYLALEPSLLTLMALHKFRGFPMIKSLRSFNFSMQNLRRRVT